MLEETHKRIIFDADHLFTSRLLQKGAILPSLVVIFGRDRGRHFDITPGSRFTIGRGHDLTHRLNDPSISRHHLDFVHQQHDGQCVVTDRGSRNGARLNNKRFFRPQSLEDGDIIQVGYSLLVFVCVTFEANQSVNDFLNDCEQRYKKDLTRLRTHASLHVDEDAAHASRGDLSGTLNLGTLFGKR